MKKLPHLILLLPLVLISTFSRAAGIDVTVDRNPISINDSFQLIFTAHDSPDDEPDFSPLQRDFDILNQQQSTQSSWTNGNSSKTIRWTLHLMAKRSGKLTVPVIPFGSDRSEALQLTVLETTDVSTPDNTDEMFLEVEATPEQPYVQAQVIYTVRFYRRVQIAQASLSEPEPENTVVEKLTEDSSYNTRINGVNYTVTERKYALFPQQSGSLTVPPLSLEAQLISQSSRSRFNGFFNPQVTRTKRIHSRTITLDVKPAPASATGTHWLPAEQVYLEQKWSKDELQVKVGEPLTRTLTLLVKGATVSQLPELHVNTDTTGLKNYPDQPLLKQDKKGNGIIAFREEKTAFIPSAPGEFTLPALVIPWFNTETGTIEYTTIPAVTVTAIAGAMTPSKPAPVEPELSPTSVQSDVLSAASTERQIWFWLTWFFAAAWLITLIFLLRVSLQGKKLPDFSPEDQTEQNIQSIIDQLKQACKSNDAEATKKALLAWGKLKFQATSLGAIAPHCEARLRDEIDSLNQHLYSTQSSEWSGKKLAQAFAENKARQNIKQPVTDPLAPLYRI